MARQHAEIALGAGNHDHVDVLVEQQALGPILNPIEMAMADGAEVIAKLKAIPAYLPAFAQAFPGEKDPITYDNVGKAIGAFERDVLTQFLIEAVVLSLFGGTIGITLALAAAYAAARALSLPFALDYSIIAMAFVFSAAVGIVFGFFPARRAASLNPIEALRHE